jgi:hypothetical protein
MGGLPESFGGPRALSTKSTSIVIYRPGDRTLRLRTYPATCSRTPWQPLTDEQTARAPAVGSASRRVRGG